MSLLKYIAEFFQGHPKPETPPPEPLKAQDPMDWRPSETATRWEYERSFCPQCRGSISHQEFMCEVCYECGYKAPSCLSFWSRSYRSIWDGEKWVWQYKWGNGPDRYQLSEKQLHR